MEFENINALLANLKAFVLELEDFFHKVQEWFDNDSWMQRLVGTIAAANEDDSDEPTKA